MNDKGTNDFLTFGELDRGDRDGAATLEAEIGCRVLAYTDSGLNPDRATERAIQDVFRAM